MSHIDGRHFSHQPAARGGRAICWYRSLLVTVSGLLDWSYVRESARQTWPQTLPPIHHDFPAPCTVWAGQMGSQQKAGAGRTSCPVIVGLPTTVTFLASPWWGWLQLSGSVAKKLWGGTWPKWSRWAEITQYLLRPPLPLPAA